MNHTLDGFETRIVGGSLVIDDLLNERTDEDRDNEQAKK